MQSALQCPLQDKPWTYCAPRSDYNFSIRRAYESASIRSFDIGYTVASGAQKFYFLKQRKRVMSADAMFFVSS